jgi:transcriptional regulator with XRE-family HTH domain
MADITKIHPSKQPRRPHFIPDWAEKKGLSQADLAREIEVDKSLVSRWFSGSTPNEESQEKLAAFFEIDREALFRHPDDDWIRRFFEGRARDEIERAKKMLEMAFPRERRGKSAG